VTYALHPGEVVSVTDGDIHYISWVQLVRLYGLRPGEYVVWGKGMIEGDFEEHLYPQRYASEYDRVKKRIAEQRGV
jgi:hypothetical protein